MPDEARTPKSKEGPENIFKGKRLLKFTSSTAKRKNPTKTQIPLMSFNLSQWIKVKYKKM